jgi:membrane protease YdiL (CAAX protease family)
MIVVNCAKIGENALWGEVNLGASRRSSISAGRLARLKSSHPNDLQGQQKLDMNETVNGERRQISFWAIAGFQFLLIPCAISLSWLGLYDMNQPLSWEALRSQFIPSLIWGTLGTIPMLGFAALCLLDVPIFRSLNRAAREILRPLLLGRSVLQLAVLAGLAGIGEELLFRWSIQGGVERMGWTLLGFPVACVIASVLFGACHWVNHSYAVFATIFGFYLGVLMMFFETWLVPAVAHGLYDFIVMLLLTDKLRFRIAG